MNLSRSGTAFVPWPLALRRAVLTGWAAMQRLANGALVLLGMLGGPVLLVLMLAAEWPWLRELVLAFAAWCRR